MSVYDINGNIVANLQTNDSLSDFKDIAYLKRLYLQSTGTVQGACTDGTYIYYGFSNLNSIIKYNILTKEVTTQSYDSGLLGHANDMTYNPNEKKIYVTVMDSAGTILAINADDLSDYSTFALTDSSGNVIKTYGIAYDRENNQYITADSGTDGKNYSFFDSSFNYVKTVTITRNESMTIQGIETDGEYLYRSLWDDTNNRNYIQVWTFGGTYLKQIELLDATEVETIMNDWNGNWYATFNTTGGGGKLYYLNFHKTAEFGTVEQLHKVLDAYA